MGARREGKEGRPGPETEIGPAFRRARSDAADAFLASLLPPGIPGIALAAVGGYGRQELSPGSDLDVVLLHDAALGPAEVAAIAEKIWYPVWDSGMKLDHSVRTVDEARELASTDLAVAAGLLDARLVAGDARLVEEIRAAVFADWRREPARRLGDLRAEYAARLERHGELAYRLEGDLKEARGGLRDSTMLRFISASWLVDVPHGAPERAREFLLDVRDALHGVSGRALDRLLLQEQDAVAAALRAAGVLGDARPGEAAYQGSTLRGVPDTAAHSGVAAGFEAGPGERGAGDGDGGGGGTGDGGGGGTGDGDGGGAGDGDGGGAGGGGGTGPGSGAAAVPPAAAAPARTPEPVTAAEVAEAAERAVVAGAELYVSDADLLLRRVAEAAATIAYAAEAAWRQVDAALVARTPARRPVRRPLADGVVEQDGEVYLARAAAPSRDPVLVLRAAAATADSGLSFAPNTLRRLAEESAPMPRPWPRAAREAFAALLGTGPGLIPVWEALDRSGSLHQLLPEWRRIRSLPQRNSLHIHTVDRHSLETVAAAAGLARRVDRPDLLLVAALLHDIGKGRRGDHSVLGAELTSELAPALGFGSHDTRVLTGLVRHHLLLPDLATRRDPDDPATLARLLEALAELPCPRMEALRLLRALAEADSKATGPAAWNPWRAGLYQDLAVRAEAALLGFDPPAAEPSDPARSAELAARCRTDPDGLVVELEDSQTISVATPDRIGLLAAVAGVLALRRLTIRAATTETVDGIAIQRWLVTVDWSAALENRLRDDLRAALNGTLDVAGRLAAREAGERRGTRLVAPPRVAVLPRASASATVLEVRAHDAPGLLYRAASTLSATGVSVRSARISTLGAEAVDVFYVVDAAGDPLSEAEAERVAAAVTEVL
ncbi:ACT domain-containing protein [Catenulispora subtropica]|uniref:Bifunctional uridylyltransferase/uridylyl-removing enzyme n=1 Tax=Catenulispora subtropica TaxID=450798 RepID=A0ABN2RYU0_9ACTN